MIYLYINSQEVRRSINEPTQDDLLDVLDGELQVVRIDGDEVVEAEVAEEEGNEEELTLTWAAVKND